MIVRQWASQALGRAVGDQVRPHVPTSWLGAVLPCLRHATHSRVEHLHDELCGVVVIPEEKEVPQPQVVGTVELLPAMPQVHVALLDHQPHVPQPAKPAASLSQLHIIWWIFTQHVHKSVRQPLQFGTRSDVANIRVIIMRWVKGRSLLLYTCLLEEVPSMILKNSKASNSYFGVAERSLR